MSIIEPDLPAGYAGTLDSLKELVTSARDDRNVLGNRRNPTAASGTRTVGEQGAAAPRGRSQGELSAYARFFPLQPVLYEVFRSGLGLLGSRRPWSCWCPAVGHIIELLKLKDPAIRDWYGERAVEHNWKLEILQHQIATGLHRRIGAAPNNLEARLPSDGAELARNVAKEPLVLDFLGLTAEAEEIAIEEAMTQRMSQTLAEFGPGFAFYGRRYHLDVEGDDFYIDLLLVHVPTNRFVVAELKSGKFKPEHLGQLNFYVAAVNDMVKFPGMAPTVGILICGSKHDPTVRYALDGSSQPIAVTSYTYDTLPAENAPPSLLQQPSPQPLNRERSDNQGK